MSCCDSSPIIPVPDINESVIPCGRENRLSLNLSLRRVREEDSDTESDEGRVRKSICTLKDRCESVLSDREKRYSFRERKPMIVDGHRQMWPDGSYTIGSFSWGKPHGQCITYNSKGVKIEEGNFRDGLLHGSGKTFFANGNLEHDGTWDNGDFVSGVEHSYKGVLMYKGSFKEGRRSGDYVWHGYGEWYYDDGGLYYKGRFENGKATDDGIFYDRVGNEI
jgi:hypothetical protein